MKRLAVVFLSAALLSVAVISGCTSESTQPATPKAQPPEVLAGRAAFQQLYIAARGWAADMRPYQLQSQCIGDNKGRDGKAELWRASFASATRGAKGNSRNDAKLVVDVDASTGDFIRKEK